MLQKPPTTDSSAPQARHQDVSGGPQHTRASLLQSLREILRRNGLPMGWLVVSFVLASLAIAARRPSLFTHAQFYAEDGLYWYADAYNLGWLHALTIPYMGYLVTAQRVGAGLSLLVPFQWAPLVMALVGLFFQALPVPILLSSRLRRWAPLSVRVAFAAVYVAIPNAREIHVVLTNSQWHLALVMVLLAFAAPPESISGKIFDVALVSLAAVTGPFGFLLLPFLAIFWYVRRQRWSVPLLSIVSVATIAQVSFYLHDHSQRNRGRTGATTALFVRLLGGNAFIGALLGSQPFGLVLPFACSLGAFLIGISLCVYCAKSLAVEVKLFMLYCFTVFAAGIRSPALQSYPRPLWDTLLEIPSQRYYFFVSLALLFAILWCAGCAPNRIARATGVLLTLVVCVGIYVDWHVPAEPLVDLNRQAAILKTAHPGEHVVFPIYPPGWRMELIKK
jgi:hypothetical protein